MKAGKAALNYKSPVTDLSTLNAVESLFHGGDVDPWAASLIGDFVDFCIYGEAIRYFVPRSRPDIDIREVETNSFVNTMSRYTAFKLTPTPFESHLQPTLGNWHFSRFFPQFLKWIREGEHLSSVRAWTALHSSQWLSENHLKRLPGRTLFNFGELSTNSIKAIDRAAADIGISSPQLLYAFDVSYRYLLYQPLGGEDNYYLPHPIRSACNPQGMKVQALGRDLVPISFKFWTEDLIRRNRRKILRHDFVDQIMRIRHVVHEAGLPQRDWRDVTSGEVRDIAFRLKLPPHLNRAALIIAGIGTAAAATAVGAEATLVGADRLTSIVVGIGGFSVCLPFNIWGGVLPGHLINTKGLKWAVTWPGLENQISK